MKTLIIYGTRGGWTRKTTEVMAEILENNHKHEVIQSNFKINKELKNSISSFDLVIVGSSIQAGFWKSGAKRFLRKHKNDFNKLAIFVTAAGTLESANMGKRTKDEAIQRAIEKYINPVKEKYDLDPILVGVFGGQYGKEPRIKFNNWNVEDIKTWTKELIDKLLYLTN